MSAFPTFAALLVGALAALFSKPLQARPLVVGTAVAAAMASHGLLDMLTASGEPVAYLWPVSSTRLFADWRPIDTWIVHSIDGLLARAQSEIFQLIIPMLVGAVSVRAFRILVLRRA